MEGAKVLVGLIVLVIILVAFMLHYRKDRRAIRTAPKGIVLLHEVQDIPPATESPSAEESSLMIPEVEDEKRTSEVVSLKDPIAAAQRALSLESGWIDAAPRESLKSTRNRAKYMNTGRLEDRRDQEWLQGSFDQKPRTFSRNKAATASKNLITI